MARFAPLVVLLQASQLLASAVTDKETDLATRGSGFQDCVVVCLLLLLVCWYACLIRNYLSEIAARKQGRKFNTEEIELLAPIQNISGAPVCVICLSSVEEGEGGRQLQCHHAFHADCIRDWWIHEPRCSLDCPTCRQPHYCLPPDGTLCTTDRLGLGPAAQPLVPFYF